MSLAQAARSTMAGDAVERLTRPEWRRLAVLVGALVVAVLINVGFRAFPEKPGEPLFPFMLFWIASYLPYALACFVILKLPAQQGRWRWIELGLILGGALLLRAMLLPLDPFLSKDSWRYLWDARVTLLGYSPYVYGPGDPRLAYLRDFIYNNSAFRNVPTVYPPGAQAMYVLSYLLAPSNLPFLKGIFMLFDLATCGALAYLLHRRGLDPSRTLLYAWCPLPIIEFAIQGHLDATTLAFSILALVCAQATWRGSRVLTGFLVAMAALTKFYPILLLVVVVRRRDWALLVTCGVTLVLAYVPYLVLGHGQVLGFLSTYTSEEGVNSGLVQLTAQALSAIFHLSKLVRLLIEYPIDLLMVGTATLIMLAWRLNDDASELDKPNFVARLVNWILRGVESLLRFSRGSRTGLEHFRVWFVRVLAEGHISMEAATLVVFGAIFMASSHIFPWYTAVLLPFAILLLQPLKKADGSWNPQGLAAAALWYFPCVSIAHYFCDRFRGWYFYYLFVYGVVVFGLCAALVVYFRARKAQQDTVKI